MTALAPDLVALLRERQAVDLDDVVEHARENFHDLAELFPVEVRVIAERRHDELREIDRAEQARAVRRQRLLAAGVGRANVLAPPVVVHLVDAIDEHEAGLGKVVRRGHDHVPHAPRRQRAVDPARDEPARVGHVVGLARPVAPDDLRGVAELDLVLGGLLLGDRERELPRLVVLHGIHELVGDQQRQVELAQPAVLAFRADEVHRVGMADVERAHLRAAPTAGRRDREAHLVVDIHERERPGGISARSAHIGAARPQRRELVADAASGLQRKAGLMDLVQDVVHRVLNRSRHRAIDRRSRGLVKFGARIRGDSACRNRAPMQRPDEAIEPFGAFRRLLDRSERFRDALIGAVDVAVHRLARFGLQPVLRVPDVQRRLLKRDVRQSRCFELERHVHNRSTPFSF